MLPPAAVERLAARQQLLHLVQPFLPQATPRAAAAAAQLAAVECFLTHPPAASPPCSPSCQGAGSTRHSGAPCPPAPDAPEGANRTQETCEARSSNSVISGSLLGGGAVMWCVEQTM